MKLIRPLLVLSVAFAASLPAFAGAALGTVHFVVVDKSHELNQTGPATVTDDPVRPFRFHAEIDADNSSGSFPTPPNQGHDDPSGIRHLRAA
ncbi:MAG: hypothetical protein WCL04_05410 [Verrucomicrobiota bacterium]